MQRPFLNIGFLGLGVIGISLLLKICGPASVPWMPEGFRTPIIAFEFFETPEEVKRFFGLPDASISREIIQAIDLVNYIDFLFMMVYAGFLFAFCRRGNQLSPSISFVVGMILSVLILVGDFGENVQLLAITAKLPALNIQSELFWLQIFTWLKWGGLALFFIMLTPHFYRGNLYAKTISIFAFLPFILGILAFFNRSVLNELFSLSIAVMFVLLIIYCFSYKTNPDAI